MVSIDMSRDAVTSPDASNVLVEVPNTTSPVYVFGKSPRNCNKRVALPSATINTPVASGSSVPE